MRAPGKCGLWAAPRNCLDEVQRLVSVVVSLAILPSTRWFGVEDLPDLVVAPRSVYGSTVRASRGSCLPSALAEPVSTALPTIPAPIVFITLRQSVYRVPFMVILRSLLSQLRVCPLVRRRCPCLRPVLCVTEWVKGVHRLK